ncbi:cobaltochelatase subunit CobN [Reyranella sp. CPCC 100927]|uniref:cobaltochelatase subunit CobN n=1 Tax=Reyranella sp. CPCC 100927 TaxID=2599616 RepID=UPI0011B6692F|nr:cobaltochelatase subunit CobN [Reyranella sp. CPCC 100927]TWT05039.1 cobaltochelatase subunit CobN [Reyranella sp. CPCC 100927]
MPTIARVMALVCALFSASTAQAEPVVRIVTNDFVLPAKFARLAAWGREAGVMVEPVYIDAAPGDPAAWIAGANLVILDTPRPNDLAAVQARLGTALTQSTIPWIRIGGGPPAFDRIAPEHAQRLVAYYANGGEANLRRLVGYIKQWQAGGDVASVAPPAVLPKAGFYHPRAPQPFAQVETYLAWGADRWRPDAPRIAFAVHASALANMQTRVIDALVAASEARGLVPLVFWFEAADPRALQSTLGSASPDVLVNLQHMLNGPVRLAEFQALDRPVLQTITFREGDPAAWRRATSGVPPHIVAPFLSLPESWGVSDPLVIDAVENGEPTPLPEQVAALLDKAAALAALRRTPVADKRLALMFWNYPIGEKNLSASHLNVPRSLERISKALSAAGYDVTPADERQLIDAGQSMLAAFYRPEVLEKLLADGLAEAVPVARYRAWFDGLPETVRVALVERWGQPEAHAAVRQVDGQAQFIVPRLRLGKLVVMPQPPRGGDSAKAYHDTRTPPDHLYLAAYLYVRQVQGAHALIHLGTHGTQEWTPGKDRGLAASDFPFLAVGDLPVFYPYIQDNIGEAIQARRRGRAVVVSHQTPAFAPAGLYDELRDLHVLIHDYLQLAEGPARDRTATQIRAAVLKGNLQRDLGWDEAAMTRDPDGFVGALHDHLHQLARHALPLGLHTFGDPAAPEHRLATVMQQLGESYYRRLGLDSQEVFAEDFAALQDSEPYRYLRRYLREGVPMADVDAGMRQVLARAVALDRHLGDPQEIEALLAGLSGGFVAPGPGGDPIRNPDVPSGRNLFAFEPDKIPTRAAYDTGHEALQKLLDAYRLQHDGKPPEKLAFSLWSSEALRHLGVLESQVLHALGLRPVWNSGGRVVALDIIPASELGRSRIDVVLQVTSVYRDQFDGFMRLLADAIERLAMLDEPGNAVAHNTRQIMQQLQARGVAPQRAQQLASLRLFSNEPGDYGSGLPDATLRSASWDSDAPLAERFLARLQYAYGKRDWGVRLDDGNLFALQLHGVQAAVLARSSRLHGMLSTDHPFEYLGGLSLAVRHLTGNAPDLYVADLRDAKARMTPAARLLADELRARYLNPHWIGAMKREGYAGTVEILKIVNNVWGWQVTAPDTVRADQWQAIHDTFVRDQRKLDLNGWFAQHNPTAQAQVVERLVEAIREGYWDASEQTRRELVERWQQLARDHGVDIGAEATRAFVTQAAAGFGLSATAAPAQSAVPPAGRAPEPVQGQVLAPVPRQTTEPSAWLAWLCLSALCTCFLVGMAWQARSNAGAREGVS